jgi:prepilin-type processing-associated H-X9-DG protein
MNQGADAPRSPGSVSSFTFSLALVAAYNFGMEAIIPVLGVAYAAVLIWLTVQIVNRPKHWDKWNWFAVILLVSPLIGVACLSTLNSGPRPASRRSQCTNNLKQIGLALYNYHDKFGCFPPAYIVDDAGRPMHSWRVLILPFLEHGPLYNLYRFDEPWDGPNNKKLADTILQIYNCPSDDHGGTSTASTMTNYVAIVGPETAWPESSSTAIGDIRDGTSNTLLIVEVANSGIHWMEPRDLHVVQMAPTINSKAGQGISSRHTGGAEVLFADGHVQFIIDSLSVGDLRALLTARAGDATTNF